MAPNHYPIGIQNKNGNKNKPKLHILHKNIKGLERYSEFKVTDTENNVKDLLNSSQTEVEKPNQKDRAHSKTQSNLKYTEAKKKDLTNLENSQEHKPRNYEIVWINVIVFLYYHIAAAYGLYLCITQAMWITIFYTILLYWVSALGVTAGAHRLWSHRSYKATPALQLVLMLAHSLANQHSVIHWARDHRLHHKYTDTDGDPHNASRGLFYSHVGWLLVKKQPEIKEKGRGIDLRDLTNNPVLRFQHRHANWFILTVAFVIPTIIPYCWSESVTTAYHLNMLRYITLLNATFLINSIAHSWGHKPYDKTIKANQSMIVSMMTLGEGFHNYHHVFSYDYRTSEMGNILFNYVTIFIDIWAYFGLVFDRRVAPQDVVDARKKRTGDGRDLWCRLPRKSKLKKEFLDNID